MKYLVNTKDKQIIIIEGNNKKVMNTIVEVFKGYQIIFQPIKENKDGGNNNGND